MKFRIEYTPKRSSLTLDPSRPIALVGSCFSANIAAKMNECMWKAYNGVGTLYNPISIAKVLELMILDENSSCELEKSLFEANGKFHSWLFDSHFSASSREECIKNIKDTQNELLKILGEAQALIVTFGTSWCYAIDDIYGVQHEKNYIVANCHKMPAAMFRRHRVSIEEISSLWIDLCYRLKKKFPDMTVIFTVSPVRHLKDGFEGNTLSKATLHLAVENICKNVAHSIYYPAFEILNDDLRDYRFYASDLVHPSDSAIEYIWESFCKTFLDDEGTLKIKVGNKIFKRLNHRQIIQK